MATLERALQLAARAHDGQLDKEGLPYILHPLRVMCSVEAVDDQVAAVLHDVVEDTALTADDLRAEGFSEAIVRAVLCLSRMPDEPYVDYVVRCKANPIACRVKLGDLQDNCRLSRMVLREDRMEQDMARIRRYVLSFQFLTDRITEAKYRALMDDR